MKMLYDNDDVTSDEMAQARPRTVTVLTLLMTTSLVFSYLFAYGLPAALVGAGMLAPWSSGNDPRMRWMLTVFASMMGVFMCVGGIVRFLSRQQMRRIDAMTEDA